MPHEYCITTIVMLIAWRGMVRACPGLVCIPVAVPAFLRLQTQSSPNVIASQKSECIQAFSGWSGPP
jgi:hypothetical protein